MCNIHKKILIVTRHTPLPWEDGAGAYLHELARFLASRGFYVEILWLAPHEHLRWEKIWRLPAAFDAGLRLRLPGALRFGRRYIFPAVLWLPFKARCFHLARRALRVVGITLPRRSPAANSSATGDTSAAAPTPRWMSPLSTSELAEVSRSASIFGPDIVIANYAWLCPLLTLPALHAARHVCLAHDIAWKRSALSAVGGPPEVNRDDEAAWLRHTDIVIAISEADATGLQSLAPDAQVLIAPKAIEPRPPTAEADSQSLLFVGSDNAFNAEGLDWFLREVWPQLLQSVPGISLHVCGSVARLVTVRPDGVAFHGLVPSLDAFYQKVALVIVPLHRSTGLNIKLVDAAAYGRAVLTTSNTLVGAPFLQGAVFVADSPAEFVSAVRRLLANPEVRAALAARALVAVRAHLDPVVCYGAVAAILRASP